MDESDVTTGHGSFLLIDVDGNDLVKVAEVDDIPEIPSGEQELYETTSHDNVDYKSWKKQPLKDGSPMTITGNLVFGSAALATLQAADSAPGALPFQIQTPQGADIYEADAEALFYNLKLMNPKDGKRTFSIQLKPVAAVAIAVQVP